MRRFMLPALLAMVLLAVVRQPLFASTLEEVRRRGEVVCGVSTGLPGFSSPDEQGIWRGLDVDFCRALAAAVLGDATRVRFVPLGVRERLTSLQTGDVDVLVCSTSWTYSRDTALGLTFVGVNYYDTQGLLVSRSLGAKNARDLDGKIICVESGAGFAQNLQEYFDRLRLYSELRQLPGKGSLRKELASGRCDAVTATQSQLHFLRNYLSRPATVRLLPDIIAREPMGPFVRQGDPLWFNVVRWTLNLLILAEDLDVTMENADKMRFSGKPAVRRLLGQEGPGGESLGLAADWGYRVISQVGNYAEIFERNVGRDSPLKLERGANALWRNGGLLYAPPLR
ncbi:MAG: amino acid ABC transporter substrate-binding protein [Desulfobulbus propionicus]|nr:MAG: amino acid ABC transporter substrate-binding protein [Desulfobulbus propionicus]